MGLFSIIKERKMKAKEMRLLILGLDNAGKSTITHQICRLSQNKDTNEPGGEINNIAPTFGFNIQSLAYNGIHIDLWDVGGQRCLRNFWQNYFEQTDGVIWVVDSSDVSRLDDCRRELLNLLREEQLSGASLLVLANKQDLESSLTGAKIAELLSLASIKGHSWQIEGCSVNDGRSIMKSFEWIVSDVRTRIHGL